MKKVVYNVTRYKRDEIYKISGIGYITEKDLIIACISKNGKILHQHSFKEGEKL